MSEKHRASTSHLDKHCKLAAFRCQPDGQYLPNRYIDIGDTVGDAVTVQLSRTS
jgi:hypothetical protein